MATASNSAGDGRQRVTSMSRPPPHVLLPLLHGSTQSSQTQIRFGSDMADFGGLHVEGPRGETIGVAGWGQIQVVPAGCLF